MSLSNQPYSKWQAIFNLEQIKERNKPLLPKKDLPKAPFFLFDLDKAVAGESNLAPNELLKQTLYTKEEEKENKLLKHGFQKKLKDMIKDGADQKSIVEYLKTLSPSGVELELISLASFEFERGPNAAALMPNSIVSIFDFIKKILIFVKFLFSLRK